MEVQSHLYYNEYYITGSGNKINEHSFFFGTLYLKEQVMFSIKYVGQNSAFFYKAFVFTE